MNDFDHDSLLKEFIRVVRRLLLEARPEPVAVAKKREPIACVLELRDRPAPQMTDGTDPHDRWFHAIRKH